MKFFIFLFAAFNIINSSNIFSQSDWVKLNSPTTLPLWKLFCVDSLTCWAAGDSGIIIHTTNGGNDWMIQNSGVTELVQDIFFLDEMTGWAVSARFDSVFGSYILTTTNGGADWEKEFFGIESNFFHAVYFIDSQNGFVAGGPTEAFYKTIDGGRSWYVPQFDSSFFSFLPVLNIVFLNNNYGFACGGLHDLIGVIWKTTNGGESWSTQQLGPEPLRKLQFIDSLHVIGVGGDFEYGTGIARTTDAGVNWLYEEPGFLGTATGFSFRKANEAWACIPAENKFMVSSDSGQSWSIVNTPENFSVTDIAFTDSMHGFAVGDEGVLLKYVWKSPSRIDMDRENSYNFNLYQNYPNPFNPITTISWDSPSSGWVCLKVYDNLGREIITLADEWQELGKHSVQFDGNKLAAGIYFYRFSVSNFTQTRAMILTK